jgi:hypothetical protein
MAHHPLLTHMAHRPQLILQMQLLFQLGIKLFWETLQEGLYPVPTAGLSLMQMEAQLHKLKI